MLKRQLPAVLLAMVTLSCASPGSVGRAAQLPEIAIDRSAAGSTVALRQGQRLTVSLPGNPTTGFVWELVPGTEPILKHQGVAQFTPTSAKLGAGGVYRFTFQATASGSAPLRIVYQRSFAKEAAPADSFEVSVVVQPEAQ